MDLRAFLSLILVLWSTTWAESQSLREGPGTDGHASTSVNVFLGAASVHDVFSRGRPGFPVFDRRTRDAQAPNHASVAVERKEHRIARIVVGPEAPWRSPTGRQAAAFRQLGHAPDRRGGLALAGDGCMSTVFATRKAATSIDRTMGGFSCRPR
jgi:hypothetical protein